MADSPLITGGGSGYTDLIRESELTDLNGIPVDLSNDSQGAGVYTLRAFIKRIVEFGMPVRADQVADRIRGRWGLRPTGNVIWDRVKTAIATAVQTNVVTWDVLTTIGPIRRRFLVSPSVVLYPRRSS